MPGNPEYGGFEFLSDIYGYFVNYFKSGIEPVIRSTALSSAGPMASAVTVPGGNSVRPASQIIACTIPKGSTSRLLHKV
jgi:hypothetical protein